MQKITPFLWFDDQAEEGANLYVSVFNTRPVPPPMARRSWTSPATARPGPGPPGLVMTVRFQLEGQQLVALNGGPHHTFTEAISLLVDCETQEEVDQLWGALSEGGEEGPCGWLQVTASPGRSSLAC
jgi:predicted 3-demethylubiquinone-9 3-methyltransferase (glyoxalase superfamily)